MNENTHLENWHRMPKTPAKSNGNPVAERLEQAIKEGGVVIIRYFGGSDLGLERRIRPIELFERDAMMYVEAHCETRKETRCFKICRIEIEGVNKIHFTRPVSPPVVYSAPAKSGSGCLVILAAIPLCGAALKFVSHWF